MMLDEPMLDLAKLMDVAALRSRVHATNLANLSTPGYRAKALSFEESFRAALAMGRGEEARAVIPRIIEPRDTSVDNDGNDVDLDREVTLAAQNSLLYNTYLTLYRGKLSLLNTGLTPTGG